MRTREWVKSTDPGAMLWDVSASAEADGPEHFVRPARRRLYLFFLHAFRPVIERTDTPACCAAVELVRQLAEGTTAPQSALTETRAALFAEHQATWETTHQGLEISTEIAERLSFFNLFFVVLNNPVAAARNVFLAPYASPMPGFSSPIEPARACALLREIFGERGRLLVEPEWRAEWRTDTVLALARQMYDSEQFGAMPILADALQDAGCDNAKILAHCRDPKATHVRGCWVLDTVLGKV